MIGLFFGGSQFKTIFGSDLGNIELDANLEETHEWSAEATENPVEEGAPVSDHVIEAADKLRIRGFISDSSVSPSGAGARGFARVSGIYNGNTQSNKTQPVFDALYTLIKAKETVTVYTKHRIYTDMILTGINIPRAPGVGEAIEFMAEFVHIRKVSTQTVDVPNGISKKKDGKSGKSTQNKTKPQDKSGNKQAETVTNKTRLKQLDVFLSESIMKGRGG